MAFSYTPDASLAALLLLASALLNISLPFAQAGPVPLPLPGSGTKSDPVGAYEAGRDLGKALAESNATTRAYNKITCAKEPCMGGLTRPQFIAVMVTSGVVLLVCIIAICVWRKKKKAKQGSKLPQDDGENSAKEGLVGERSASSEPAWATGQGQKPWNNVDTRYEPMREGH